MSKRDRGIRNVPHYPIFLWTNLGAAMRAAIMKGINLAVFVAGDDNPVAAHTGSEEIARVLELALMPEPEPDTAENAFHFFFEDIRIRIQPPADASAPDNFSQISGHSLFPS